MKYLRRGHSFQRTLVIPGRTTKHTSLLLTLYSQDHSINANPWNF